jgi:hypothetical protein
MVTGATHDVSAMLAAGCWLLLTLAVLLVESLSSRYRSRALERKAQQLSFSFASAATPFEGSDVRGLSLLGRGAATVVTNLLQGKVGSTPVLVFDLPFCYHEVATITTFAAFRCPTDRLPALPQRLTLGMRAQDFSPAGLAPFPHRAQPYQVERSSDWLFLYRPGSLVPPSKLPDFVTATAALASTWPGAPQQRVS